MEEKQCWVRISDYGVSKTKAGGVQVFIDVYKDGDKKRWYGSPFKKDGSLNDMCILQLAACGFDPSIHKILDLEAGPASEILVTDEDVECEIGPETAPTGEQIMRVKWIGAAPRQTYSREELKALVTDEQEQALKSAANKFRVRKKKVKLDPEEDIAF